MTMEFKPRSRWKKRRSITTGRRSTKGQIIWKGKGPAGDVFLVRVGKDGSRQVTGTKDDALRALEQLIEEVSGGSIPRVEEKLRFGTWLDRYLQDRHSRVAPSTYRTYSNAIEVRLKPALGALQLGKIRKEHLQQWVDGLFEEGLSEKCIRNYLALAKAALRMAHEGGILRTNPGLGVSLKSSAESRWLIDPTKPVEDGSVDPMRVWSHREMRDFFANAPSDHEMTRWVLVGLRTGLRPQEQCGLRWMDLHLDEARLRVTGAVVHVDGNRRRKHGRWAYGKPKTGSRYVTLPPDAVEALRAQHHFVKDLLSQQKITDAAAAFVFPIRGDGLTVQGPDKAKGYNSPDNIRDRLRYFVNGRKDRTSQTGLPGVRYICPYGLRHTHATDLIRNGWHTFVIAKRLGTSQMMIEQHYGHWLPDVEPDLAQMSPLTGSDPGDHPGARGERSGRQDVSRCA